MFENFKIDNLSESSLNLLKTLDDDYTLKDLMNGESNNLISGGVDYEVTNENKFTLPYINAEVNFSNFIFTKVIKREYLLGLFLLLISKNPFINQILNEEIKCITISILMIISTSGCLNQSDHINRWKVTADDFKYTNDNLTKETIDMFKKVILFTPDALNFLSISTINYIKFNHHYPHEKVEIIRKLLKCFKNEETAKLILNNKKPTTLFYNTIVNATKAADDFLFFSLHIWDDRNEVNTISYVNSTKKIFFNNAIIKNYHTLDPIVSLRRSPITNGYWILDILQKFIDVLTSYKLLFILPSPNKIKILLEIRKVLKKKPFINHPGIFYHGLMGDKDLKENFDLNMTIIGGILFEFCNLAGGSLESAKCKNKYEEILKPGDKQKIALIKKIIYNNEFTFDENLLEKVQQMNNIEVIDPDNLEESNSKVLQILNSEPRKSKIKSKSKAKDKKSGEESD